MELRPSGVRRSVRISAKSNATTSVTSYLEHESDSDADSSIPEVPLVEEETLPVLVEDMSASSEEEDARHPESITSMKECTVTLSRLRPEDEEKEDMIRKSGKQPTSRIPTSRIPKRPTGSITEPMAPSFGKKELTSQTGQPMEHSSGVGDAGSRPKLPSMRETALPLLSARLPKYNSETSSQTCGLEETLPKQQPMEEENALEEPRAMMTVDPRPALRAETVERTQEPRLPEDDGDQKVAYDPASGDASNMDVLQQYTDENPDVLQDKKIDVCETVAVEEVEENDPNQIDEYRMEASETVGMETVEQLGEKDLIQVDSQEDEAGEEQFCEEVPHDFNPNGFETSSTVPEIINGNGKQAGGGDEGKADAPHPMDMKELHKQNKTSCCWSMLLFCLFPSMLLLFGGFGQHLWHYGVPSSMSHLMAQLELHWLEGIGLTNEACSSDCRVSLVESIPLGIPYSPTSPPSISNSWISLLEKANHSVDIAAFYFTLRDTDLGIKEPSSSQGEDVFKQLTQLQSRGVKLRVAVNSPQSSTADTADLARTGAEVREVDLQSVTGGIVHTKLWVVDQEKLYLGSANMDWRSLTQVKEVGVAIEDCSCLAQDASRIFEVYWTIGAEKNGSLPPYWPARFSALSSAEHPLTLRLNGVPAQVYLSSAPPHISARGRSDDLATILSVISDAQKFVDISVMDYLPMSRYTEPIRFWPAIDSAIRAATCTKGVEINLLVSCWQHSPGSMFVFLKSLAVLNTPPLGCNINIKVFRVPSTPEQEKIPFARVNHAKYMVTDRVVYIGTSNWSENYFTQTAGVGLVVNQTGSVVGEGQMTLQSQLHEVFKRDWTSEYAQSLDDAKDCGRHHH